MTTVRTGANGLWRPSYLGVQTSKGPVALEEICANENKANSQAHPEKQDPKKVTFERKKSKNTWEKP